MKGNIIYGDEWLKHIHSIKEPNIRNALLKLDPKGFSVVTFWMYHNGVEEIRAMILCKLKEDLQPHEIILTMQTKDFFSLIHPYNEKNMPKV